jgi:DNA-binding NtrC family response regulator
VVKGLKEQVANLERTLIINALHATGGIQSSAAVELGISERVLRYKMKIYGVHVKTKLSGRDIIVESLIPYKKRRVIS